mmetsp:Transcript_26584/g.53425  ORF Transcript_26584/g.53425 Transcript_26584/m.53425 type:complete len:81 (-) Transcript_26584:933-1175(-)
MHSKKCHTSLFEEAHSSVSNRVTARGIGIVEHLCLHALALECLHTSASEEHLSVGCIMNSGGEGKQARQLEPRPSESCFY